jgi:hypothetical protein
MLPTFASGRDIYVAELPALGKYAVIGSAPLDVSQLRGSGGGSSGGGGGSVIGIVVGVAVLLVVVGLFLLGRWRRARAAAAEPDGSDE